MDFSKLKQIKSAVQANPQLEANNRFSFGQFRGVPFAKALERQDFKRWIDYIISIEDNWTETMEKDMANFNRYVKDLHKAVAEYNALTTLQERLEYIFRDNDQEPVFWFGKYRNLSLDLVPEDYKLWWVNQTISRHPLENETWWNSPEGVKTYKLLIAVSPK